MGLPPTADSSEADIINRRLIRSSHDHLTKGSCHPTTSHHQTAYTSSNHTAQFIREAHGVPFLRRQHRHLCLPRALGDAAHGPTPQRGATGVLDGREGWGGVGEGTGGWLAQHQLCTLLRSNCVQWKALYVSGTFLGNRRTC